MLLQAIKLNFKRNREKRRIFAPFTIFQLRKNSKKLFKELKALKEGTGTYLLGKVLIEFTETYQENVSYCFQ
ncbi:hypothetical protein [Bartonella henselae]|uniref:hypothetical protein n=1 Tax=Bartonella henselae TaxID=38323 RepID=UPI0009673262|nr:hypothetical protein [Bartonella henselae]OLL53652.1 hypothetical protein AT240_02535 [Bartonella henselae]OLL55483.1 hypothetical protein AT239_06405 [Bartonella henselae]